MTQPIETTCPLGLICAQMTTEGNCPNRSTCFSAKEAIDPLDCEDDDDEELEDALSGRNPYLYHTFYPKSRYGAQIDERSGWFWIVNTDMNLPSGYSPAVDANLPAHSDPGVLTVTLDKTISGYGTYQRAEWNQAFWFEVDGSSIVLIEWIRTAAGERSIRLIHTEDSDGQWWCDDDKDGNLLCSSDAYECPEAEYWVRHDQPEPKTYGDQAQRVDLPIGEELAQLKKQIESIYTCEESFYCTVCEAATYEADFGWSTCKHLKYCNHLSSWAGVGYSEEDYSDDYAESFALLAQQPKAEAIRKALEEKNWKRIWDILPSETEDELEPAIAYLQTLDSTTPSAFEQCLEWMPLVHP